MKAKQTHCTPSCTMPSTPAMHSNVSNSLQQPASWMLSGKVRILANPAVAEVVPSRTKYGEMPSEVPRMIIR